MRGFDRCRLQVQVLLDRDYAAHLDATGGAGEGIEGESRKVEEEKKTLSKLYN